MIVKYVVDGNFANVTSVCLCFNEISAESCNAHCDENLGKKICRIGLYNFSLILVNAPGSIFNSWKKYIYQNALTERKYLT